MAAEQMRTVDLAGAWRFSAPGHPARTMEVPGFWEEQGALDLDGSATYERDVEVPVDVRFATLEFDAVADLCRVWLNGEEVGGHENGFTPFTLDVSGSVRSGRNLLRVDVEDPAKGSRLHLETVQGKQGWGSYVFPSPPSMYLTVGGIWQPCRLVVHGAAYISDLWCDMDPDEPCLGVTVHNASDDPITAGVAIDAFGQCKEIAVDVRPRREASVEVAFEGAGVQGWSPAHPVLHRVDAEAVVDGVPSHRRSITTGLRRVEVRYDDVLIDGRPYRMRSALHQGYWPRGIYRADPEAIDADIRLALDAGLNSLRTHLKVFEPEWLDVADRAGLLLQCDTPIGEPIDPEEFNPDSDYGRRCVEVVREQVRRDRSRPSILMWTLMNEMGLHHFDLLESQGYRDLVSLMTAEVRRLDPTRAIVENDWLRRPEQLVESHVRTPHWYGRGSAVFTEELDGNLAETSREKAVMYVTEFGEWALPVPEGGDAFFDSESEIADLVRRAGWPSTYEEFARGTHMYQGWSNRLQAERMRCWSHVRGFCLTQWTDVPHELNGLVSIRRGQKELAIEMFRPALEDVAPIAAIDRFCYEAGDAVEVRTFVSNWSDADLPPGELEVHLGDQIVSVAVPSVAAGDAVAAGTCRLIAPPPGNHELLVAAHGEVARYGLQSLAKPEPLRIDLRGPDAIGRGLERAGWELAADAPVLVVAEELDESAAAALEREAEGGRTVVVLSQSQVVPLFERLEVIPQEWGPLPHAWGPTPFFFTTTEILGRTAGKVLSQEVYNGFPANYLLGEPGAVGIVIPPPGTSWGSVVAVRRHGRGSVVSCQLQIEAGLERGAGPELSLLAELVELGVRR